MSDNGKSPDWWAIGLLFENCNCQLICPAHISFKQNCTHERCQGYWAILFEEGAYGDIPLHGLMAAVFFDTPQRMYEGGWIEKLYLDVRSDASQKEAVETILKGNAGGPWAILARFVGTWQDTRTVAFQFEDEGTKKSLSVEGLFETRIEALRGAKPGSVSVLENLYNTIHGLTHVLARGSSRCTEQGLTFATNGTHALYSNFSWEGP
jgi:hypothetical protein